ncbi:hypothetical protein [Paenibacillus cucumis (ex Kampfer et al. 2016)]|uniref:Butirosin biosynthesis protein H N-terminal domain-containing protein n=1 Tax=Paenibacillus cucumis (ex Kampfer et al. 2016) TaxID=1776858 RepID=A0ABS7KK53_9BACL|nr:hypothetical protein [Paenibacillus cucumis (ex Kampfer et al. 2016)]MBY0204549.1 hypothetical protein [Paenibacillus cucumis (ex Kampfer et al. 2016)]
MVTKILPISQPKVIGFLHHAYPLSILGNHNEYIPWFYNNFIQIICNPEYFEHTNDHLVDFYFPNDRLFSYPCIETYASKPEFSISEIDIVDYTINSINNDCYVYTHVDEFYIPNRKVNKHFTHNILVYGYEDKKFNVLGFNEIRHFASTQVPFEDFRKAYNHADYKLTILYSYNNYITPQFNIYNVMRSIKDYLLSINTIQGNCYLPPNPIFGIDTYYYLKRYVEILKSGSTKADIRPFHILLEHKTCMVERINYMREHNYIRNPNIYSKYKEIEKLAYIQRNIILKYSISLDPMSLSNLANSIDLLIAKETDALNMILDDLQSSGFSID